LNNTGKENHEKALILEELNKKMAIFGVSEPIIIGLIVLAMAFVVYGLPYIQKKRSIVDYDNFDLKHGVAFWSFAGNGGPGYVGLQPIETKTHVNNRATVKLEGLPNSFTDVKINETDDDCDVMIKRTADALFGTRIDVLCKIDANGCRQQWDNVYVQNWQRYRDMFKESAKSELIQEGLVNREIVDEIKGYKKENIELKTNSSFERDDGA
jgi:hypothetical protein